MSIILIRDHDEANLKDGCEREPVHIPGSIQPHGVLLVLGDDEAILQTGGDLAALVGFHGEPQGRSLEELLGLSLVDLLIQSNTTLRREPTYVGTVDPCGRGALTVTAHVAAGGVVIELERAVESRTAPQLLASIQAITEKIGGAASLLEAAHMAVEEVRTITGYDRVMTYQFLADGSGTVIAESKAEALAQFLHHRYPASDIPTQARELYRRSPIRVIADVDYVASPLAPLLLPDTDGSLDMSHCVLRSVSPTHLKYLKNMGVGASMSVSLLLRGDLWGLIACHNTKPLHVHYEARELCKHVARLFAQKIQALMEADEHRISRDLSSSGERLLRELQDADDPASVLLARCSLLQEVVDAGGVAISWKGSVTTAGLVPSMPEVEAFAHWLRAHLVSGGTFATDRVADEYPGGEHFAREGAGVVALRLQGEDDAPLLIWFRAEQIQEVSWAGNPHEPLARDSRLGSLNPRRSFATWVETVKGRSRPWRKVEVDAALSFGQRLAPVLQQQRVRELNAQLLRANEQLEALAATDAMTGLGNRRAFDERLEHEWARAGRRREPLALITFDVDFFKQYNDHFGHPEGDNCLRQLGQVIAEERRTSDFPARVGGEEFSILLPETDLHGASVVAEKIRLRLQGLRLPHPISPFGVVTASFGLAVQVPDGIGSGQDLVRVADKALYAAKAAGRDCVAGL